VASVRLFPVAPRAEINHQRYGEFHGGHHLRLHHLADLGCPFLIDLEQQLIVDLEQQELAGELGSQ